MNKWMMLLLAVWLAAPAVRASAADEDRVPGSAAVAPAPEGRTIQPSRKARRLAKEFEVSPAEVQALRDRNMGWGEIRQALSISQRSGKPVAEIVELRDSGMGWGEIAARYDLAPGNLEKDRGTETLGTERHERSRGETPHQTEGEPKP